MNLLNIGFSQYSAADFLLKGNGIVAALTTAPGSTYFPTVVPSPNDLHDLLEAYELTVQEGNAPGAVEDRKAARDAATAMMQAIAANLEDTSTDRDKLAHTGYTLRKVPEHDPAPTGIPQDVTIRPTGIPGEAKPACRGVAHARTYEAHATQNLESGVFTTLAPATSIRGLLFTGLERGKDWFFQIRAIGPNGVGPWSDPAMLMVT